MLRSFHTPVYWLSCFLYTYLYTRFGDLFLGIIVIRSVCRVRYLKSAQKLTPQQVSKILNHDHTFSKIWLDRSVQKTLFSSFVRNGSNVRGAGTFELPIYGRFRGRFIQGGGHPTPQPNISAENLWKYLLQLQLIQNRGQPKTSTGGGSWIQTIFVL